MNWSKNLYVFMLSALIVFSGCFGTGTTDGEGDDDAVGTTIINYYNNSTSENEPVWYTSGGTYTTWNDDNSYTDSSGSKNFMRWSNNGSQHSSIDDWNLTECETQGGVAILYPSSSSRDSIYCDVTFSTINTSTGEVLKIYQWSNFKLSTTCDGVSEINYQTEYGIPGNVYGNEYIIITGSALNCEHRVWNQLTYSSVDNPKIWSIVYTIQDAIVV